MGVRVCEPVMRGALLTVKSPFDVWHAISLIRMCQFKLKSELKQMGFEPITYFNPNPQCNTVAYTGNSTDRNEIGPGFSVIIKIKCQSYH